MAKMLENDREFLLRIAELFDWAIEKDLTDASDYFKKHYKNFMKSIHDPKLGGVEGWSRSDLLTGFIMDELFDIEVKDNERFSYKFIEEVGGEGEGTVAHTIFFFHDKENEEEGNHYKISYEYFSHEGYNFDDSTIQIVEAKPKMSVEYV